VKTFIRNRDFFKLPQALEIGAEQGMWTFDRYQTWMSNYSQWHVPNPEDEAPDHEEALLAEEKSLPATLSPKQVKPASTTPPPSRETKQAGGPIEIEPVEGGLGEVIKRLT
jgi:hypothetical protein